MPLSSNNGHICDVTNRLLCTNCYSSAILPNCAVCNIICSKENYKVNGLNYHTDCWMKLQGNYQHMQPIVPAQAIPFNREPSSVNTPPFNEGHQTATGPSHFDQSYMKNKSPNEDSHTATSPSHADQSYIKNKSLNEAHQSARGPSMSDIKHMSLNEGGSSSPMDMLNKFYADLPFDMNADLNLDQSTNQIAPSATDFNPFSTNQVATPGTEINLRSIQ